MVEVYLDETVKLPDEIELVDETKDDDYLFNLDQEEARRERAEVNHIIRELIFKGLWREF